jgi:Spy/CpxP family protein refolding chaperone
MTQINRILLLVATLATYPASRLEAQDSLRFMPQRGDSARRAPKQLAFSVNRYDAAQDAAQAFAQHLFPPELVMQHQARLKITEAQRNVIVAEISKLQATAVQVQWRVGDESEKLAELLQRETVAEADVLAQADRMIMYETAVKRAQLSMLIRIRNTLTPEQRQMLQELRKFSWE